MINSKQKQKKKSGLSCGVMEATWAQQEEDEEEEKAPGTRWNHLEPDGTRWHAPGRGHGR